jgi:uncharacterized protein (TIGR01777 family)
VNVLVAGGGGLIGTALIDHLRAGGAGVTRLVRPSGSGPSRPDEVLWDPTRGTVDLLRLDQAGPFSGVVNLAGAGIGDRRWSASRKQLIAASRISSARQLVEMLSRLSTPPAVLVSASAVGYYGDRGDEVLTEASAAGAGFLADLCQAWEVAAGAASSLGIRTVLLRSGIVLSRAGGALGKQLPLFRLGLGGPLGTGHQFRSWITLADEIGVIVQCLGDLSISGPVNATAPHPVTDRELARAIGAALHRPVVLPVPATALKLALGPEMASEFLLGGQRVLPAVLGARGFEFAYPDLETAMPAILSTGP